MTLSQWIPDKQDIVTDDEFNDFLTLYNSYLTKKTSDLVRLKTKIEKMWDSFSLPKKKYFTQRLIELNAIDTENLNLIRKFNGSIHRII